MHYIQLSCLFSISLQCPLNQNSSLVFVCLFWSFTTIDIFKVSGQLFYRKYLIWGLSDVSSRGVRVVQTWSAHQHRRADAVFIFVSQQEAHDVALSHSGDVNVGQVVDVLIHMTPPLAHEALLKVKEGLHLIDVQYLKMWRCSYVGVKH